jgi:hypothetical protein
MGSHGKKNIFEDGNSSLFSFPICLNQGAIYVPFLYVEQSNLFTSFILKLFIVFNAYRIIDK